jgi:hypothetical protein
VGERLTIEDVLSDHVREALAGVTDTDLRALAGAMPRPLRGRARRDLVPGLTPWLIYELGPERSSWPATWRWTSRASPSCCRWQ